MATDSLSMGWSNRKLRLSMVLPRSVAEIRAQTVFELWLVRVVNIPLFFIGWKKTPYFKLVNELEIEKFAMEMQKNSKVY